MERLEGEAARGSVSRDAGAALDRRSAHDAGPWTTAWRRAGSRHARRLLRLYAIPDGAEQASCGDSFDSVPTSSATAADEIAWHARQLYLARRAASRACGQGAARHAPVPGLQVMIYLPDQKELFARICGFLRQGRGLSILDAKVHTTGARLRARYLPAVHDPLQRRTPLTIADTIQLCRVRAVKQHACPRGRLSNRSPIGGRMSAPSQALSAHAGGAACFPMTRERTISSSWSPATGQGLLARIAYTLAKRERQCRVSAKINTLGERVEDVFLHRRRPAARRGRRCSGLETALYEQLQL